MYAMSFSPAALVSEISRLMPAMVGRLSVAAVLGASIGLERTLDDKPAGLRTSMFICFGSALFTILSGELAGANNEDHSRIASNIITGIGFIGAGSILHSKNSVVGLTSAATIFVVAAIGMAVGTGLYASSIFATVLILLALRVLGGFENRYNIRSYALRYETSGPDIAKMTIAVADVLDAFDRVLHIASTVQLRERTKIVFNVTGRRNLHEKLLRRLSEQPEIKSAKHCPTPADE